MVKITLKNYRAFSDEKPLIIDLAPQFTALLGPNNSGKSSFLLSFFELRNLWHLFRGEQIQQWFRSNVAENVQYLSVRDPIEIFHNANNRDISIEIKLDIPDNTQEGFVQLNRVVVTCRRSALNRWQLELFSGLRNLNVLAAGTKAPVVRTSPLAVNVQGIGNVDCATMSDTLDMFGRTLYIGPYRSAIPEVTGSYYDLEIGHAFISTWRQWKLGVSKAQNAAVDTITQNIKEIFKYDDLEINPDAEGKGLHVRLNGRPYRLQELGAGLAQFIIVFANAAIKKPRLILIDEPELNLHPTLQMAFLSSLASYAEIGVIFATHSVGLARSIASKIYSFRKPAAAAEVRPFESAAAYTEFLGEMSFAAYQELGYDSILFVEGVNDVLTAHQFLRMLRKENRIVVFPLHGNELASGNREIELSEVRRLSKNMYALVDSERASAGAPPDEKRRAFMQVCDRLKIRACVTERRAIENYLTDGAVKEAFGEKYRALGAFERLADANPSWKKSESWRAARLMSPSEIKDTDLFQFLDSL